MGMETVLLHTRYALECWERPLLMDAKPLDSSSSISCIGSVRELERRIEDIPRASLPIDILVDDKKKRDRSDSWRCQAWSKPFPPHSLWQMITGVPVIIAQGFGAKRGTASR